MAHGIVGVSTVAWIAVVFAGQPDQPASPLQFVRKITLAGPTGKRLDHLALDSKRDRLFVANMANASFDVIDIKAGKVLKSFPNQHGIQGVAYADSVDRVFVGVGEDGVCNVFDGEDYQVAGNVKLDDADNVRFDPRGQRIFVAHAPKSISILDPKSLKAEKQIALPGQPEAFQLEKTKPILYVNVPSAKAVVAIDTDKGEVTKTHRLTMAGGNYPLALDERGRRLFVGCRTPPTVLVVHSESGKTLGSAAIPADVDDVFYDERRKLVYAACGEGFLTVLRETDANHFELAQKIPTAKLARTCLFDAEQNQLFLTVPRQEGAAGPEVWVYRVAK